MRGYISAMATENPKLEPTIASGWYVRLNGDDTDLEDWDYTLNPPFDPIVLRDPDGTYLLTSEEFSDAQDASEVNELAKALINRLNGALALMHNTKSLRTGGVVRVDEHGNRHVHVFAEALGIIAGFCKVRGVGVAIGPDGHPLPSPPPQESDAQRWNKLAAQNDVVADLLEQRGKASDWYEMYKTIELAERLVGGEHRLKLLLGGSANECKNFKRTANYYRHARADRPEKLTTLEEGKSLLNFMVRHALVHYSNIYEPHD